MPKSKPAKDATSFIETLDHWVTVTLKDVAKLKKILTSIKNTGEKTENGKP